MIDGKNFFDESFKNDIKTYGKLQVVKEIITQLLDYNYFIKQYKLIAIDSSKQRALDADQKAIQQMNFTGNLYGANNRVTAK